jgi:DNA (cytosine-5)-methyltransferase 1
MKAMSLFSGVGGFDLGFQRAGIETLAFAENDKWAAQVLSRHWPEVPNFGDVTSVGIHRRGWGNDHSEDASNTNGQGAQRHFMEADRNNGVGDIDIIHGGFPCQDLSVAGKRAGLGGERSNLWFEFQRILSQLRPRWTIIENVPGLLSSNEGRDFAVLLESLGECGFNGIAWCILDAQHFGVPQRRRRVFIVGGPSRASVEQVLSICESCGGNPLPGRKTTREIRGEEVARTPVTRSKGRGENINDTLVAAPLVTHPAKWANEQELVVAQPLRANRWGGSDSGGDEGNVIVQPLPVPNIMGTLDTKLGTKRWLENQSVHNYGIMDAVGAGVRRLTPLECERLMGWPDDWTRWDSENNEIADTHRYRMCGNGVVAPVAEWIGRRIMAWSECR